VMASYRFDPQGNLISSRGSLANANLYRFSTEEVHPNTGMYHFPYRFYDPSLQRWTSRDPVGELGGLNLYTYVANDPIDYLDPLGLAWYNPFSWNWSQIGSAVEVKVGGQLGLGVKAGIGKLEGELGAEYGMGKVLNFGGGKYGKTGIYNEGKAGFFIKCQKYEAGLGKEWEMQNFGNRDPDDENIHREEKTNTVVGLKSGGAGADSKNWTTLKLGGTLVVVHGEASVNFGTIWKGITQ
jgi:RHS repeat-associated protein